MATNNIKIAFLTPYLSTGGAERVFINIATDFFRKNIHVQIVAGTIFGNTMSIIPDGLPVFELGNKTPLDSPSFYKNTKAIIKYLKAEKPDVVITTSDYLNMALVMARYFSGVKCKIVFSQQTHLGSWLKELKWINRQFIQLIQRIVIRNSDLIIGVSEDVTKDFANHYKLAYPSSKIITILNPVYEEKIVSMSKEPVDDPAFNHTGIKIINVGRLVKLKGHATLLHAFKMVLSQLPDAHLYIIGIGVEKPALEALLKELGIAAHVHFLGYKDNPYAYVARCDLFVLSSTYEGFGNVIVEALATGINVVSTNCPGGPAEILNYGEYGTLCPVDDPQEMSQAIVKAVAEKKPADFLHARAEQFGIGRIADQYFAAAASLVK